MTLTPITITQVILAILPTSLINSDLDFKERFYEFFNWVKKWPNWVTLKLIIELKTILNILINNFYDLKALYIGISKQV